MKTVRKLFCLLLISIVALGIMPSVLSASGNGVYTPIVVAPAGPRGERPDHPEYHELVNIEFVLYKNDTAVATLTTTYHEAGATAWYRRDRTLSMHEFARTHSVRIIRADGFLFDPNERIDMAVAEGELGEYQYVLLRPEIGILADGEPIFRNSGTIIHNDRSFMTGFNIMAVFADIAGRAHNGDGWVQNRFEDNQRRIEGVIDVVTGRGENRTVAMSLYYDDDSVTFRDPDGKEIILAAGSYAAATGAHGIEGAIAMDVTPAVINDTLHLPVRFVFEFFGFEVDWCNDTRSILLTTP
ncbi:MAG: stalk domain-containing protein [Defluviitaleaceae bacterium]|nr:stalk domain-containing protein [Defluviitaleaceae bacterium]